MPDIIIKKPTLLFVKVVVIFVPVYCIAYFTKDMVYILPTIAVGMTFGSSLADASDVDATNESSEVSEAASDAHD